MKRLLPALSLGALALGGSYAFPGLANLASRRPSLWPSITGIGRRDGVALTFDDGPDPSSTPAFLEALDRLGWEATFFQLGRMVDACPGLAAEVAQAGHEVAVHGYEHRSHLLRTPSFVMEDLRRGYDVVGQAAGRAPVWHRPPYGAASMGTMRAARRLGMRVILWSTWGRDWEPVSTPQSVMTELSHCLEPGSTILLHDSSCTSAPLSWRSALGALDLLAEQLALDGLSVRPLRDHGVVEERGPVLQRSRTPGIEPSVGREAPGASTGSAEPATLCFLRGSSRSL